MPKPQRYMEGFLEGELISGKSFEQKISGWIKRARQDKSLKGDQSDWARGYRRALNNLDFFLRTGEDA